MLTSLTFQIYLGEGGGEGVPQDILRVGYSCKECCGICKRFCSSGSCAGCCVD